MAVITVEGRIEDDSATEDGTDANDALLHLPIPKLELPSILLAPLLIQVNEEIEAAFKLQPAVNIEVCVNSKMASALRFVQATTFKVRICDQTLDPRQLLEKTEERAAV